MHIKFYCTERKKEKDWTLQISRFVFWKREHTRCTRCVECVPTDVRVEDLWKNTKKQKGVITDEL
jgi:hypothetical protein